MEAEGRLFFHREEREGRKGVKEFVLPVSRIMWDAEARGWAQKRKLGNGYDQVSYQIKNGEE